MTTAASSPLPLLGYADVPARHGIAFEATPGRVTILIPRPGWVHVLTAISIGAGTFVFVVFVWSSVLFALGAAVVVLATTVAKAGIGRPTVIEVTEDRLRFANVHHGQPELDRSFPRWDVQDVKYVCHSSRLVVHARGQQMYELALSRDPALMTWLADTIHQALSPTRARG
jgi:hypothetical protein